MTSARTHASGFLPALAVTLMLAPGLVLAQQPAAPQAPAQGGGRGYENPAGMPAARPPSPDIAPIYKSPAIDTLAMIRQRGVLKIGIAPTVPFVMHDAKGELAGISIDVGRKLAEDLGVQVEFVQTSWVQIIPDLVNGHFDLISSGLWITPARALLINFSEPSVGDAVYLIASRQLAGTFSKKEDFDKPEVTLVVVAGTIQEQLAATMFPKAKITKVEGDTSPFSLLVDGKAHAALITTPVPQAIVDQQPDKLSLPIAEPLQTTATAMGVRKGDPDFLNYLNSWIAFHKRDGWLDDRIAFWSKASNWASKM